MIIDNTVSRVESEMRFNKKKERIVEDLVALVRVSNSKMMKKIKKQSKKQMVRDFLIAQGKDPGENFNYIASWRNDSLHEVLFVVPLPASKKKSTMPTEKEILSRIVWSATKFAKYIKLASSLRRSEPSAS